MDIGIWIVIFVFSSLFWCWILFWGGAEWLEGTFLSGLLLHMRAPLWSEEGLKIFAGLTWLIHGVWFLIGLFVPSARAFWMWH
jgi:hypothetical protein